MLIHAAFINVLLNIALSQRLLRHIYSYVSLIEKSGLIPHPSTYIAKEMSANQLRVF